MKPSLVILAAGMGSRYGGLKQIDGVGPGDETIIEYSIYDALRAGFGKIVFVIRKDIEDAFRERFEAIRPADAEFVYVFQEMDSYTNGQRNTERTKPWGTAHAVLVAWDAIQEPFAVINADDYYGNAAFADMAGFLQTRATPDTYAMMGYQLSKTLSDHGSVSRGVCAVNENGNLHHVDERTQIQWQDGDIIYKEGESSISVDKDSAVSMNFWGFHPTVFPIIEKRFHQFIQESADQPKAEFFIPLFIQEMIDREDVRVNVLPCEDRWYGVTYKEDKPMVQEAFRQLVKAGTYPHPLWG
ncbi:MAG: nucleotidyltransferase [Saprospiraceae bacterium]|nr:nucleotidyltransferase [Saprospiraceae bacterium]